jgi:hypothetical protein
MSLLFTDDELKSMTFECKEPSNRPKTNIPKTIKNQWIRLTCREPDIEQLKAIGYLVSQEYKKMKGKSPPKQAVQYGKKSFKVNKYTDRDFAIVIIPLLKRLQRHPERITKAQRTLGYIATNK